MVKQGHIWYFISC